MASSVKISRTRRTYNRWVANETLEDFALRFTARKVRKWSVARISNTAIGAVSFLALEAIGGSLMLSYGFSTSVTAIISTCVILFLLGVPISYNCAKYGVDIDLLTRGSGFGYLGSTITSLIYASFTFIFFAIEAAIMAAALELCFSIPLPIGYLISTLIFIPLVTHGITLISKLQAWSQPIWIVLQLAPFIFILFYSASMPNDWTEYTGLLGPTDGGVNLMHFGAASAVLFSLVAQIGEQVDYLRFLPEKTKDNRVKWWIGLLSAGPGWIVLGGLKVLAGCFLAYYAFRSGVAYEQASEPTHMYLSAYNEMISNPGVALALTGIFVVICQIKINVTNTYAGSIAWSNFFSRLTHSHPGRVVWVVFNVLIGLLLVELGVYRALEEILGLYSIVAVAWLASIVVDLVINKPLGLAPKGLEFKRAYLYDINPVGFGSTLIASAVSLLCYFGLFGQVPEALYSYVALTLPFVVSPLIAIATKGKFYLARNPEKYDRMCEHKCSICELHFEAADMVSCPVYDANICSLCCSLDRKCGDGCKEDARFNEQAKTFTERFLPPFVAEKLNSRLGRYLMTLTLVGFLIGLFLSVVFFQAQLDSDISDAVFTTIFVNIFAISLIIAGIVVWLFILAHESRILAEDEAKKHTNLLMKEIEAHEETDRQLQHAKEKAESANLAKSKYVVGLSHELRTPLNSILGYAQLLERQKNNSRLIGNAAQTIKRSGEHLAGLIEGLLDISKIEAGKIQIFRDKVAIISHFQQLVDMISVQAQQKNIDFKFECADNFPSFVYADEKRLRQVLLNLLSNAVKFTEKGCVTFRASYSSQIATIEIEDTGYGIAAEDIERIFLPFERVSSTSENETPQGTGLGLTITKLLVEIMGGELRVESKQGVGSKFIIRLMLSSIPDEVTVEKEDKVVTGYRGDRRVIFAADDDPTQRMMVKDALSPLGFDTQTFATGQELLNKLEMQQPDIVLLDIGMPGLSGWETAEHIRKNVSGSIPILMISADAGIERLEPHRRQLHDGYLTKPIVLSHLIQTIGSVLKLNWEHKKENEKI